MIASMNGMGPLARWLTAALLLLTLFAGFNAQAQTSGGTFRTPVDALRPPPPPGEDPPYNDALFSSQSVPTTMTAGAVYTVTVNMVNNGTTTWTSAQSYKLGSRNPYDNVIWSGSRVAMAGNVYPGQTAVFTFNVAAPSTAGSYNFQWAMVQDGVEWFGPASDNVVVNVVASAHNNAQFISQSVPYSMVAGGQYGVSVTFINNGNTTWDPTNGRYSLVALDPLNNGNWGWNRAGLGTPVAPGEQRTIAWTVTAPSAPGNYNFQWIMGQEGVEIFGAQSDNVVVSVSAPPSNGAAALAMNVPPLTQGQNATISVTMQNTGTTTWPAGSNYKLGSKNPDENLIWGVQRVDLANDVAPGQQYTFTFPITAPAVGTYTMQWQMMQRYVEWFGAVASGAVTVSPPAPVGDTVTYIHTDGLGSPVARSDSAGNVVSRTAYEPYGRTASGTTPTIGFTGHVNDADTGLVYMQQRYYDPVAGRFLSVDPVTTDASTGSSFNRYVYANNNPYRYIDPDGRDGMDWVHGVFTAASFCPSLCGSAVSGVEGVVYLAEGKRGDAGIAFGAAAIGMVSDAGLAKVIGKVAKEGEEALRAGKAFTKRGKDIVKEENAAKNGGKVKCENCGVETVPGKKSESGVTPPGNEAQVDHIDAKSKGGAGDPSNGQVLCRDCNIKKSDN
jgi:RHS repeat-associated protein